MQAIHALGLAPQWPPRVCGAPAAPAAPPGPSFNDVLQDSLQRLKSSASPAARHVEAPKARGETDVAAALVAVAKAHRTFGTVIEVQNKLVAAYNEIKDLPV